MDGVRRTLDEDYQGINTYLFSLGSTLNLERSALSSAEIVVCGKEKLNLVNSNKE